MHVGSIVWYRSIFLAFSFRSSWFIKGTRLDMSLNWKSKRTRLGISCNCRFKTVLKSSEPWTRTAWRYTARNEDTHFFQVKSHNRTELSMSYYMGYSVSLVILDLSLSSAIDECDCTWYPGADIFGHAQHPYKHWFHFRNTICYATARYICKKNLVLFCDGLS